MTMNWQEICDNPAFNDLPFKFETNEWGKIEMCPASNEHSLYQMLIIEWLIRLGQNGKPLPECSIQTNKGVKVADVAWASFDFFKRNKRNNPYLESPEVVIEILSPSNTRAEMEGKKQLYFEQGAQEFWLCDKDGTMLFFTQQQQILASTIIADFPNRITIDFA
jgi:Uma2 family endonuclease